MAQSLSAEARGPLPCQCCLGKRRARCLGRSTEALWYENCWRQWKEPAFDARLRHMRAASLAFASMQRVFPARAAMCWTTTSVGREEGLMRTALCSRLWRGREDTALTARG